MLREGQAGLGGGGKATWPRGPNMGVFFKISLPSPPLFLSPRYEPSCPATTRPAAISSLPFILREADWRRLIPFKQ